MMSNWAIAFAITASWLCTASVRAQDATPTAEAPTRPATYGTANVASSVVSAWNFSLSHTSLSHTAEDPSNRGRYFTAFGNLKAGVNLPNGAIIEGIELQGCDNHPTSEITVQLRSYSVTPPDPNRFTHAFVQTTGADGCRTWSAPSFSFDRVVDNSTRVYYLELFCFATDASNSFHGVRVFYRLQVSPAPATATFGDVPVGHPLHRFVEALRAAGITSGCGGGNYCPDSPLTRGQMAVFLAVALGLHWPN